MKCITIVVGICLTISFFHHTVFALSKEYSSLPQSTIESLPASQNNETQLLSHPSLRKDTLHTDFSLLDIYTVSMMNARDQKIIFQYAHKILTIAATVSEPTERSKAMYILTTNTNVESPEIQFLKQAVNEPTFPIAERGIGLALLISNKTYLHNASLRSTVINTFQDVKIIQWIVLQCPKDIRNNILKNLQQIALVYTEEGKLIKDGIPESEKQIFQSIIDTLQGKIS